MDDIITRLSDHRLLVLTAVVFLAAYLIISTFLDGIARMFGELNQTIEREHRSRSPSTRMLRGIGEFFSPLSLLLSRGRVVEIERLLVLAGRPFGGIHAEKYLIACYMLGVGIGLAAATVTAVIGQFSGWPLLGLFLVGAVAGGFVAHLVAFGLVQERVKINELEIERDFPFFLDLAVLIVQAGGTSFDALRAFVDASGGSALGREVAVTLREAEATSVHESLLRMANRIQSPHVRQILRNLAQADRSTGKASSIYIEQAEELRSIRHDMAVRAAETLKMNMKIPEVLLVVAISIAVLTPAFIQMGLL